MMFRSVLAGATSLLALAAAPASGQSAAATEATGDEIVVTAQLREQDPIEVPIAVSALSGEELSRLGLEDFEEVGRFIPGFDVQNQSPNNPGFVMRGITSDSGAATIEPRVSVFQDGISISKSRGSFVELFDVDRVEVSKGPQSTLYGRGALIGAVNIVQRKADPDRVGALARLDYGNYDQRIVEAMVNAPLSDGAAVRIAGRYRKRDGYVDNLLGGPDFAGIETGAIRGSVHFERDRFTIDLIGNYQRDETTGTPFKSRGFRPTNPVTGAVLGDARPHTGATLAPGTGFEGGRAIGMDREVWGLTALASYQLSDALSLSSLTGYRKFDAIEIFDGDGLSLPVLTAAEDAEGKQFSQELRLIFEDGPVTAFVGASYFHETGSQRAPAEFDERALLARLAGVLNGGPALPGRPVTDPAPSALFANTAFTGTLLQGVAASRGVALTAVQAQAIAANLKGAHGETSTNFSRTNAFDIFGDVAVRVGDRLELGAGLRYTHDDKRTAYTGSVLNGRSILGGFIAALGQPAATRTALLGALARPGAAAIPPSAAFPVPLFGLSLQPTAGNGGRDSADLSDDGFSWRFTARYELSDRASLYGTYARGRRPRVLSTAGPAAPFAATPFDVLPNERVDSFETGIKTALLDRTLFLDGSIFYYDYRNFQTVVQNGTTFVTTNAGKADSYGFEGQARWVPSASLSVIASYGHSHGRFSSGIRDGNRFRLSPDHQAALGMVLSEPIGSGRIAFSPSVTYQSRVFFDDDNDISALQQPPRALVADTLRDETQGGYALVNARLGYEAGDRGWRIEAFVENLFDKHYVRDAGNTGDGIGLPTFIAGDPRFYGVSATVRFGGAR